MASIQQSQYDPLDEAKSPNTEEAGHVDIHDPTDAASKVTESSSSIIPIAVDISRSNQLKARKRTKTGCLTCRKRRIKCGEERPTCSNCVKSKRNCEGYQPRVIFKDPLGSFRPVGGATPGNGAHYQHLSGHSGVNGQYARILSTSTSQAPLPVIAPRPLFQGDLSGTTFTPAVSSHNIPEISFNSLSYAHRSQAYHPSDVTSQTRGFCSRQDASFGGTQEPSGNERNPKPLRSEPYTMFQHQNTGDSGIDMGFTIESESALPLSHPWDGFPREHTNQSTRETRPASSDMAGSIYSDPVPHAVQNNLADQEFQRIPMQESLYRDEQWSHIPALSKQPYDTPNERLSKAPTNSWSVNSGEQYQIPERDRQIPQIPSNPDFYTQNLPNSGKPFNDHKQPFLIEPVVSVDELVDDYYDVNSDEEGVATDGQKAGTQRNDLGLMLSLSVGQNDRSIRTLTSFLNEPNVLSTYQPTYTASPLMDAQTARVFCHYVTATAPSLSIFERRPSNPSVMFTGGPIPISQQSLWTYTLPMMALSHRGLLHSMLALASLHIAKLQQTSTHASLKHYHFAIRRVTKVVGLPSKRPGIPTLAASLLLGFYEVISAEHHKWNSHLAGASQLIMEIDFAGMTKRIKAHKALKETNKKSRYYRGFLHGHEQPYVSHNLSDDLMIADDKDIDENLVSTLMGWKVRYDQYGRVTDDHALAEGSQRPLTSKGIETYEIQSDLFWWYAKQDLYQSMVSGNRLLLPYDRWGRCPPRASVGRLDAVYGTMDHLTLLMGRVTDFVAKDLVRKRKAVEANGGQWRPPPGMFAGPPPAGPPQPTPSTYLPPHVQPPPSMYATPHLQPPLSMYIPPHMQPPSSMQPPPSIHPLSSMQPPPPMYGMMPPPGPMRMPDGFIQTPQDDLHFNGPPPEYIELEAATREAESEWNNICSAFNLFEETLSLEFLPLSPEYMQPLSTPFGPAIYYRTYSIACVWALYYTGRIIAARVEPSMPPAAMMAAGIAAPRTAEWANTIGRIYAGLLPPSAVNQLNPSLAAALTESTLSLFFAGVQFRDAAQRGWTIATLRNVSRLTGWQSSNLIAAGCEVSWTKMAEAGRGPPYQVKWETAARDDRVAGRRPADMEIRGRSRDNNDRSIVALNPGARVHWAMGVLSADEDMARLSLSN